MRKKCQQKNELACQVRQANSFFPDTRQPILIVSPIADRPR